MTPSEEIRYLLNYEAAAADWWLSLLSSSWLQDLAAHWLSRKVGRKLNVLRRVELRKQRVQAELAYRLAVLKKDI